MAGLFGLGAVLGAQVGFPAHAADAREELKLRLAFGHRSPTSTTLTPRLVRGSPGLSVDASARSITVGAGSVDVLEAAVSWPIPTQPKRKPHSIWQHLLDHGGPGQVARLKDDPGLTPDAPVLTVVTAEDGTRGFSIGLEQLARHQAMWLPEHDVLVTLADAPVDFATHVASLRGERVLDRVQREPEATLAQWTNQWADFGNPTRPHHGQETEWLGTREHLTGFVTRHGSLYKFGVDRWASVRPDHASPHKFRFDPLWPDCQWKGQRIENGLPILITLLERGGQRCEVEQFAATLRPMETARSLTPARSPAGGEGVRGTGEAVRGEIPSVFLTDVPW